MRGTRKLITKPIERDTFAYSTCSGSSFAAAKVTGLLAQAMLDCASCGKEAIEKVINPSLLFITLRGGRTGSPASWECGRDRWAQGSSARISTGDLVRH